MLCPRVEVAEFLQIAADVGLEQVELHNDLPEWGEIDQLGAEQFRRLAERLGVRVAGTFSTITEVTMRPMNKRCVRRTSAPA